MFIRGVGSVVVVAQGLTPQAMKHGRRLWWLVHGAKLLLEASSEEVIACA